MQITVLSSPFCALHNMDEGHPESPQRLHQINDQLIASGLESVLHYQSPKPADKALLQLVHSECFVEQIYKQAPQSSDERVWIDDDTIMMQHTLKAALYAAGSGRDAVDLVMQQPEHLAFCTVRPPGHHAKREASSGFCIFNNVAIAAYYAMKEYGLTRIAIVDFDVHHGDGTESIVQGDTNICFCSSFQHPFYPFSGSGETADNVHNIPIAGGTKGDVYRDKVAGWFETLDAFEPELILISAGFDAHVEEGLAYMRLVEDDYFWLAQKLTEVAQKHAQGRMVAMLEGGYALSALSRSVVAFMRGTMAQS